MPGPKKKIAAKAPKVPKKATPTKPGTDLTDYPSWRFRNADHEFPPSGGWNQVSGDVLQGIIETLQHCEQHSLAQLFKGKRDNKGACTRYSAYRLDKITNAAKKRLHDIGLGEIDHLIRIRADGNKKRLFAWQVGAIFQLIWWDPEHEVWPTEPKNT